MKKALAMLLVLVMVLSVFAGCQNSKADEGKVLNIWAWNEEFKGFFDKYYASKIPEGITVNWVINANEGMNYQNKLDAALRNQANAPADEKIDIFLAEADYILKYTDSDYTQDVKALGVTDFSNAYEYTVQAASANGVVKGVSFQCCPAALIYRRSIAKEVIGTDDPAKVQEALSSWDKFDAVAATAKEKGYLMTASEAATFRVFSNNGTAPLVNEKGELALNAEIKAWMAQAKEYADKGYTLTADIWSDECTAQMAKDGKALCYFGPAWYFNFSMGPAAATDGTGSSGDWAICQGPQPYFWGGTWLLAATGSDNPQLVADIMNAFINDEEICTNLIKNEAQFTNNKKVNKIVAEDPTYGSAFLGGQNDVAVFLAMADGIKFENKNIYDQAITEGLQGYWREYCDGTVTEEQAMANYYAYLKENCPDLIVP